ncbi:MAG: hypothetical protein L6R39_001901 [Caloplaca ligustica]|nr:MAG: hypothetical protein L6R39_001901 [Caloplaca ligustica]
MAPWPAASCQKHEVFRAMKWSETDIHASRRYRRMKTAGKIAWKELFDSLGPEARLADYSSQARGEHTEAAKRILISKLARGDQRILRTCRPLTAHILCNSRKEYKRLLLSREQRERDLLSSSPLTPCPQLTTSGEVDEQSDDQPDAPQLPLPNLGWAAAQWPASGSTNPDKESTAPRGINSQNNSQPTAPELPLSDLDWAIAQWPASGSTTPAAQLIASGVINGQGNSQPTAPELPFPDVDWAIAPLPVFSDATLPAQPTASWEASEQRTDQPPGSEPGFSIRETNVPAFTIVCEHCQNQMVVNHMPVSRIEQTISGRQQRLNLLQASSPLLGTGGDSNQLSLPPTSDWSTEGTTFPSAGYNGGLSNLIWTGAPKSHAHQLGVSERPTQRMNTTGMGWADNGLDDMPNVSAFEALEPLHMREE